jgi:putative transposase
MNTDQGSQFTSEGFTSLLQFRGVAISMDGRGRWMDNIFTQRLWRSVKYEEVYLTAHESLPEARRELAAYFGPPQHAA